MSVLWGTILPQLLHKLMSLVADDPKLYNAGNLDTAHIHKFAGLGTNGVHPDNTWQKAVPTTTAAKVASVCSPMKHIVLGRFFKYVPMLLPHELSSATCTHYPEMWSNIVYPRQQICQRFWRAVQGSEQFRKRPARSREGFDTWRIPSKNTRGRYPSDWLGKRLGQTFLTFSRFLVFSSVTHHTAASIGLQAFPASAVCGSWAPHVQYCLSKTDVEHTVRSGGKEINNILEGETDGIWWCWWGSYGWLFHVHLGTDPRSGAWHETSRNVKSQFQCALWVTPLQCVGYTVVWLSTKCDLDEQGLYNPQLAGSRA